MKTILLFLLLCMSSMGFAQDIADWNEISKIHIVPSMDPITKEPIYDISEIYPDGTTINFPRYSYEWNHYYRGALNREPPMRPESREMYRVLIKLFKKQFREQKVQHGNHQ